MKRTSNSTNPKLTKTTPKLQLNFLYFLYYNFLGNQTRRKAIPKNNYFPFLSAQNPKLSSSSSLSTQFSNQPNMIPHSTNILTRISHQQKQ